MTKLKNSKFIKPRTIEVSIAPSVKIAAKRNYRKSAIPKFFFGSFGFSSVLRRFFIFNFRDAQCLRLHFVFNFKKSFRRVAGKIQISEPRK